MFALWYIIVAVREALGLQERVEPGENEDKGAEGGEDPKETVVYSTFDPK